MKENNEVVRLDEICKLLCNVSKKLQVNMINALFDKNYKEDEVDIELSNGEFVTDILDTIRGDILFNVTERDRELYHIEFQTSNDTNMVIRMFNYGYNKASESIRTDGILTLKFPSQRVIFIEENNNIEDTLKMKLQLPDNKEIIYEVPVMKYWEYDGIMLIKRKLYSLLPLQLILIRKKLQRKNTKEQLQDIIDEIKELSKRIAIESRDLLYKNEMEQEDLHKVLLSIQNLVEYLNNKFLNDEKLEEEVSYMTKTLYDPEVEKRGLVELICIQLKQKFKDFSEIEKKSISELPLETVKEIGRSILVINDLKELNKYIN